jgi:hypothetical protein
MNSTSSAFFRHFDFRHFPDNVQMPDGGFLNHLFCAKSTQACRLPDSGAECHLVNKRKIRGEQNQELYVDTLLFP